MKLRRYLNEGESGSSPADFKPLGELTEEEASKVSLTGDNADDVIQTISAEEMENLKSIEEVDISLDEGKKEEEEIVDDENKEVVDDKKETNDDVNEDDLFKIEEEKENKSDTEEEEEIESSWKDIAKEFELEIEEDNFDKFKEKLAEKQKQEIEKAVEEAKKEFKTVDVKKYNPEAQRLIEFLENGGTLEEFKNPLKVFDELLTMDKEDLIREDLRIKGYSEAQIEEKIIKMDEDGIIDTEYNKLKNIVSLNKEKAEQNLLDSQKNNKLATEKAKQEQFQKETKVISEHISKLDKFMGKQIPEDTKKLLQQRWEEGHYRKRFAENPVDAVNAILFMEFGEKFKKLIEKEAHDKGAFNALGKLSNTPEKKETPGQRDNIDSNRKDEENYFSAWEEGLKRVQQQS